MLRIRPYAAAFAAFLACLAFLAVLIGCSDDQKVRESQPAAADSMYAGWQTFTYDHFRIKYPPEHPRESLLHEMVTSFTAAMNRDAALLGLNVPSDTIEVMMYTGTGQGQSMTGHKYPYVSGDTIYYWLPSYYGEPIIKFLLKRWVAQPPSFKFLREGLIVLLDFSGINYHKKTIGYLDKGDFVPLGELAVDTVVSADRDRWKSAEAASFVDFVLYRYGRDTLRELYTAQPPFDSAVQRLLSLSVDSLQTLWLDIARRAAHMDSTGFE